MAEHSVYVETTILSYLVARPSRILTVAARQQTTRDWWDFRRSSFDLCLSQLVLDEASLGDSDAAARRLEFVRGLPLLEMSEEATALGDALIREGVLPEKAARDALHTAIAAVHGIDFLMTWNCTHLANAEVIGPVGDFVLSRGYEPPTVCTPDELMGDSPCPEIPS